MRSRCLCSRQKILPFFASVLLLCSGRGALCCRDCGSCNSGFVGVRGKFHSRRITHPSRVALRETCHQREDEALRLLAVPSPVQCRRTCLISLTYGVSNIAANTCAASGEEITSLMGSGNGKGNESPTIITLPLEPASGGTFCVRLTVYASNDNARKRGTFKGNERIADDSFRVYKTIVDTGSPYLVLPFSGPKYQNLFQSKWESLSSASDEAEPSFWLSSSQLYPPTEEIYGAVKGLINWKLARYSFRDPRLRVQTSSSIGARSSADTSSPIAPIPGGVVGVLDESLTIEATGGGKTEPYALLGLILNSNPSADRTRFPEPRPTFFEQERVVESYTQNQNDLIEGTIKSFSINGPNRELTLSTQSLIPATVPSASLVDLRAYGDFVDHYAVSVSSLAFNGVSVSSLSLKDFIGSDVERPIVAVFDTGLTGCLIVNPFWDALREFLMAKDVALEETASISVIMESAGQDRTRRHLSQNIMSGTEDKFFYVEPIDLDWFDDPQISPFVIVLGQTFLRQGELTLDMVSRRAFFNY